MQCAATSIKVFRIFNWLSSIFKLELKFSKSLIAGNWNWSWICDPNKWPTGIKVEFGIWPTGMKVEFVIWTNGQLELKLNFWSEQMANWNKSWICDLNNESMSWGVKDLIWEFVWPALAAFWWASCVSNLQIQKTLPANYHRHNLSQVLQLAAVIIFSAVWSWLHLQIQKPAM